MLNRHNLIDLLGEKIARSLIGMVKNKCHATRKPKTNGGAYYLISYYKVESIKRAMKDTKPKSKPALWQLHKEEILEKLNEKR